MQSNAAMRRSAGRVLILLKPARGLSKWDKFRALMAATVSRRTEISSMSSVWPKTSSQGFGNGSTRQREIAPSNSSRLGVDVGGSTSALATSVCTFSSPAKSIGEPFKERSLFNDSLGLCMHEREYPSVF